MAPLKAKNTEFLQVPSSAEPCHCPVCPCDPLHLVHLTHLVQLVCQPVHRSSSARGRQWTGNTVLQTGLANPELVSVLFPREPQAVVPCTANLGSVFLLHVL